MEGKKMSRCWSVDRRIKTANAHKAWPKADPSNADAVPSFMTQTCASVLKRKSFQTRGGLRGVASFIKDNGVQKKAPFRKLKSRFIKSASVKKFKRAVSKKPELDGIREEGKAKVTTLERADRVGKSSKGHVKNGGGSRGGGDDPKPHGQGPSSTTPVPTPGRKAEAVQITPVFHSPPPEETDSLMDVIPMTNMEEVEEDVLCDPPHCDDAPAGPSAMRESFGKRKKPKRGKGTFGRWVLSGHHFRRISIVIEEIHTQKFHRRC